MYFSFRSLFVSLAYSCSIVSLLSYFSPSLLLVLVLVFFFFANFAVDGEHSLVKTNVYYTRLAEPKENCGLLTSDKLWTN